MEIMMRTVPRGILLGVGLVAMAALLFEVSLTRIFAVTLWYYFAFLAISLALLGMAVAAVICFLYPNRFIGDSYSKYLTWFSLIFAITTPISIYAHIHLEFTHFTAGASFYLLLAAQIVLLFVPFFAVGMCISIAMFKYGKNIATVYFYDLVGASIGSFLVVPLLTKVSAPAIIFGVSMLSCASAWFFANELNNKRLRSGSAILTLVALALFLGNDFTGLLKISRVKSYRTSQLQEVEDQKIYEKWSPVSRVTVMAPRKSKSSGGEYMRLTYDAGAPTTLHKFDGDLSTLDYLTKSSRQIVHHLKSDSETLVIGSGGGLDVLAALKFNQKKITAVELNPVTYDLVLNRYADYIGRIFHDPRVTLHNHEGRNFVAGTDETYDIIQITMIDSWTGAAAGAFIFNENSLYTKEAISDYMRRLQPDGILAITRYYHWDEAARLTNMMVRHLLDQGITDVDKRMIVTVEKDRKYRRATMLLKNGTFTKKESARTLEVALNGDYPVIYAPFLDVAQFDDGPGSQTIQALINPNLFEGSDRDQIVAEYPRNIKPSTDDRPFFFFMSYLRDAFKQNPDDHAARRLAMPLLYGTFIAFTLIGVLAIFLPLYLSRKADISKAPCRIRNMFYFSMLGVGFMLIEVSLIQRLTVFLGHPTYSFVVVLASMLFASGLGSLASGRWSPSANPTKLIRVLAGIVVLTLFYVLIIYDQFIGLMWLNKTSRILLAVVSIFPPAFLMGMCFPMGIQISRRFHEHLVPWGWGVNGAFSVFASICSLVIALNFGLKITMGIGVFCYFLALLIVVNLKKALPEPLAA